MEIIITYDDQSTEKITDVKEANIVGTKMNGDFFKAMCKISIVRSVANLFFAAHDFLHYKESIE